MVNFQYLAPAIEITAPPPLSPSTPRTLRPANEVLDEVYLLTHLDSYTIHDRVVAAFDENDVNSTPRAKEGRGSTRRDVNLGRVLSQIADLVKAYDLLQEEFQLRTKAITMFVQEVARPGVARLVEAGEEVWTDVYDLVEICRKGSQDELRQAEVEADRLLLIFGVVAETHLETRASLHDALGWKLRHVHFVYALALVSSMNCHTVDFNWQIWEDPAECFMVNKSLEFRKHDIGSMAEFLGQVWVLAKKTASGRSNDEPARPGPSLRFQILVSITQLWSLWHADINFAVTEEHLIEREQIKFGTMHKKRGLQIQSLEVGSGMVLPIVEPALRSSAISTETVCGWCSLDLETGNIMGGMADVACDFGEVEVYESDMLLIL